MSREGELVPGSMFGQYADGDPPPGCTFGVEDTSPQLPENVIRFGDLKYMRIAREFFGPRTFNNLPDPDPTPAA